MVVKEEGTTERENLDRDDARKMKRDGRNGDVGKAVGENGKRERRRSLGQQIGRQDHQEQSGFGLHWTSRKQPTHQSWLTGI